MKKPNDPQMWPELHARVELLGPWYDMWLPTIIEDRDGGLITVGVPNVPGTIVPVVARAAETVTLHWVSAKGAAEVHCSILEIARHRLVSWHLQALGLPVVRQRRAYVRADVHLPLQVVAHLGEPPLGGWAVNLSEGGLRLVTTEEEDFDTGRRVLVEMDLDGLPVFVQGEVLRVASGRDGQATLALKFVDLHHRDADRIRRHVFAAQLRTPARQS